MNDVSVRLRGVPATVVGGYLGSGKTTLINGWLRDGACEGWALLVNDLGSINVDAERLRQGDGRVLELGGGCVCCTLRDGLGAALLELAKRDQPPAHVLIEASGMAVPERVAGQLSLHGLALARVLLVVDLERIEALWHDRWVGELVQQQFEGVDLLQFSKRDLLAPAEAERREQWLYQQLDARGQRTSPPFHRERQLARSDSWLQLEPLERGQVLAWAAQLGPEVLRAKGELWLAEVPDGPVSFDRVGDRVSLAAAPSRPWSAPLQRRGQLVVISRANAQAPPLALAVAVDLSHPRMKSSTPNPLAVPFLGVLASLQLIDPTVANTALVKAAQALHMHGSTMAFAASISTLAQAATVLLMGFLGDRLGRREVLMASLLLSIAGDAIALSAPSAELFLLGRALVGIGVGAVLALTFASVRFVSRPEQLGQALGVWNLLIIAGFIGGSLLGGVLADSSWRLALGLVPVIALLCLPLVPVLLPEMPANRGLRADWPGLITIAGAMVLVLTGVSHAVSGLTSPEFLIPTLAGVLLFGVHVWIERSRQAPIFPVSLYARGCFAAAIVSGIAWNFAQAVVQLQTSNFWQVVQRYSTSQVAFAQLPLLICFAIGGVVAGRLMSPGRRTTQLMAGGVIALVLGLFLLAGLRADSAYPALVVPLLLVGTGLAFISVPQSALFVQEAPPRYFGSVTAFRTTTGQLGFALGFAASGAMVNGFGFASLRDRLLKLGASPAQIPALEDKVRALLSSGALTHGKHTTSKALEVISQSYASGLAGTMIVVGLLVALLGAISLLLLVIGHQQGNPPLGGAQP